MLRRLAATQPMTFAFTPANQAWAEGQMTKFPEGRQASAIIPLLWRAQEQEGWLTRPAIEHVADMLGLAYIRALEVATFYFMFHLQPVGTAAHLQICGTTSCMICGAEDLVSVCREHIAPRPHEISADGQLSWEEVECLGACANAPMAQIGKDYYEDLSPDRLVEMIAEFRAGGVPAPGSQTGRFASEPLGGATALVAHAADPFHERSASGTLAHEIGDTVKRIDGTEVPLRTPWQRAETADPDPQAAGRDPMLGPSGPDGAQGGRARGAVEPDRMRGDASDGMANVRGSDADTAAKPDEGDVAPAGPDGHPGEGLGEGGAPAVTGTTDTDGEPAGSQTAVEATATPAAGADEAEGADVSVEPAPAADRADRRGSTAPGAREVAGASKNAAPEGRTKGEPDPDAGR